MSTKLKERPLVLTTEEVNAVLAGDKTQHRMPFDFEFIKDVNVPIVQKVADETDCTLSELVTGAYNDSVYDFVCPLGKVGDRLWVQEDFIPDPPAGHDAWEDEDSVTNYFQWDGCGSKLSEIPNRLRTSEHVIYKAGQDDPDSMMWFNALQMRKWASRLLLEVTDIRIERVQNTSHDDAVAEGAHHFDIEARLRDQALSVAQIVFSRHWDTKHEDPHTDWESNPWVWVIEFKKVDS